MYRDWTNPLTNYSIAMDTIVFYNNLKKFSNTSLVMCLFLLLTACPGEEDCFDMGSSNYVPNLISLTPEQSEYSQGDLVTLSLVIPATNTYFGNELNLFQKTGDSSALLALGFNDLFIENVLNIIIGSQANFNNQFYMPYNPDNDTYELNIEVTLNKVGDYSFVTSDRIEFIGNGCDRFVLDTNVQWNFINGKIEFTVIE